MKTTYIWDAVLAVGVLLAVLLLGQIAWGEVGGKGDVDLWSVISALATAAATIVALYVAIQAYREKGREEHVRARLTSARLAPLLLRGASNLKAAHVLIARAAEHGNMPGHYGRAAQIFEEVSGFEPSIDELRSIAILQDDCADRIAACFAQLRMLHKSLKEDPFIYGIDPLYAQQRRERASMYIGMTKGLLATIEPAVAICNAASRIKVGGVNVK